MSLSESLGPSPPGHDVMGTSPYRQCQGTCGVSGLWPPLTVTRTRDLKQSQVF